MKTVWEKLEVLTNELGTEEMLDNLCQAMGITELEENLNYIARMWDVHFDNEEDEE